MTSVGFGEETMLDYKIYDKRYKTNTLQLWDNLANTYGVDLDIGLYKYFVNLTNVKVYNNNVGKYKSLMRLTKEICKDWCKIVFTDDYCVDVGLDTEFLINHTPVIADDLEIGCKITDRYIICADKPIIDKEIKSLERYTEAKYAYDIVVDNRF
uniref:Uncharacterized protein n=1 Tax=Myoviridae sp. ctXXl13 TaxID=2827691 RepID=A0A8S5TJS4_9CAUD|nr:MAG TPA: hypothetical protein [Myoviridae sp. ctXXl13]